MSVRLSSSVIGGRPDFDEGPLLALGVQALDYNKHAGRDPRLEQDADLGARSLVCDIEFQNAGDGMAGPVFGLRVFTVAAGSDAGLNGPKTVTVTPSRASGHVQDVATPT